LYTDRQGGITYTYANINAFLGNTAQSVQYLGDLSAPSPFFNNSTGQALAKQTYYIAYAQDEWKVKPNLTLNYGLRYEYYTPLREAHNRQILFNIDTGVLRDPSQDPLLTSKTNFGPRVALTWSPNPSGKGFFGGGRTVLRGGAGIYYGPGQTEDQIQPIESNRISSTLSNVNNAFPQDPAVIAAAQSTNVRVVTGAVLLSTAQKVQQDRIATMNPPEASIHELWVKDVGLARTRDAACAAAGPPQPGAEITHRRRSIYWPLTGGRPGLTPVAA